MGSGEIVQVDRLQPQLQNSRDFRQVPLHLAHCSSERFSFHSPWAWLSECKKERCVLLNSTHHVLLKQQPSDCLALSVLGKLINILGPVFLTRAIHSMQYTSFMVSEDSNEIMYSCVVGIPAHTTGAL